MSIVSQILLNTNSLLASIILVAMLVGSIVLMISAVIQFFQIGRQK
jgi:hypothetical protein